MSPSGSHLQSESGFRQTHNILEIRRRRNLGWARHLRDGIHPRLPVKNLNEILDIPHSMNGETFNQSSFIQLGNGHNRTFDPHTSYSQQSRQHSTNRMNLSIQSQFPKENNLFQD
jgi:hypothetical protein